MRRPLASLCALACVLLTPAVATATSSPRIATAHTATGTVTAVQGATLTIQTSGRQTGVLNAMVAAANAVTKADYPYVFGGGHAAAGIASVGQKGPGYNGKRRGLDCSGSVVAVLAGAGLWPAGTGVPSDAGVIAQLKSEHLIARGRGSAPAEVNLYDNPGVHIFMNINGRFFGTSDGGGGNPAQPKGGAGWLSDGAPDARSPRFKQYHVLPSVLRDKTTYGHVLTFENDSVSSQEFLVGDKVRVSYTETSAGSMIATSIAWVGAATATGTVTAIAGDGGSFTVQTPSGSALQLSTSAAPGVVDGLATGDTIQITYTRSGSTLLARTVTVTGQPAAGATPGTGTADGTGSTDGSGDGGSWGQDGYGGGN